MILEKNVTAIFFFFFNQYCIAINYVIIFFPYLLYDSTNTNNKYDQQY